MTMSPFLQTTVVSFVTITANHDRALARGHARRDVSIVDPFWGMGFVIVAWIACWLNCADSGAWLAACWL